jgi:hypothetical protein
LILDRQNFAMTPPDAAKLLEVAPDSTPEQIEARFLDLRRKLEDKIAKAPTPGLKEKYRATLAEVTTAFETLTLAADSSALPVLQRGTATPAPVGRVTLPRDPAPLSSVVSPAPSAKKSPGKEFVFVAVVAVVVLAGGGWFIMKTRAENAEKERIAAEAKLAADRKAEEAKLAADQKAAAEKQRAEEQKKLEESEFARLRSSQAEARIRWDNLEKEQGAAEKKLGELKADVRNTRDLTAPQVAELQAQFGAQTDYVDWLQPYVSRHPAKTQLAKLDALLSARAIEEAGKVAAELTRVLDDAEQEVASQKKSLLALGRSLQLVTEPAGVGYRVADAYGRQSKGTTPGKMQVPWGRVEVVFTAPGPGWPDITKEFVLGRTGEDEVRAVFPQSTARIESLPAGLSFELTNPLGLAIKGSTPADIPQLPAGPVTLRVKRPDWPDVVANKVLEPGASHEFFANFVPGKLTVTSEPSGATILRGGKKYGVTPQTFVELVPGKYDLELQLKGYKKAEISSEVIADATSSVDSKLILDPAPEQGKVFTIPELGLILNPIAAGQLKMGSNPRDGTGSKYDADEMPQTAVTFSRPFWMGRYEVSQAEWIALMPENPSANKGAKLPVESITWVQAVEFCRKLTEREKEAGRLPEGYAYTLPSEAQWEYACRAGLYGQADFYYSDVAWYEVTSGGKTHPVGEKKPNAWGLYDMRGNVSEWCMDWYGLLPGGSVVDPKGPMNGTHRVVRGGGYDAGQNECRAAYRNYGPPEGAKPVRGFRVALTAN